MKFFRLEVVLLLITVRATSGLYWYGNFEIISEKGNNVGKVFPPNTSCLYGLKIPRVLERLEVCNTTCKKKERNSLAEFYKATNGKQWYRNGNWNSTKVVHCQWQGVLCHYQSGHVISINLPDNNLKGKLTYKLQSIYYLLGVCFSRDKIEVSFEEIGKILPRYTLRICLAYNRIAGSIPHDLSSSFPLLAKLQLTGNNELSGILTEDICKLKDLQVLSIGETRISGSVPKSIGNLTKLWFLDFEALGLSGDIAYFRNLSNIIWLHVSSNTLKGHLPHDVGNLYPNIKQLLIQNNELHGNLPDSIGSLKNLRTLNVAKNYFNGKVPSSIGRLNLDVLILSDNLFSGFADNILQNSTSLSIFLAANNKNLHCEVQNLIKTLSPAVHSLRQLDISNSNITGNLPANIFQFTKLSFLKLAKNRLTSSLPVPQDNMPYMSQMDLSYNDLSGAIPRSFSRLLMLLTLDLRGNFKMRGEIDRSYLKLDATLLAKEKTSDSCPLVRFSHNNGLVYIEPSYYDRKYCFCNEHFYGIGGICYPCMAHALCPGVNSTSLLNATSKNFVAEIFLEKGFWPFPHEDNAKQFLKCPVNLLHNDICVPGERCACKLELKSNNFHKSNVQCDQSCLCAKGHTGRFCSQCRKTYYQEGIRCIKCLKGSNEHAQIAILVVTTIVVLIATIIVFRLSKVKPKQAVVIAVVEIIGVFLLSVFKFVPAFFVQALIIVTVLAFNQQHSSCKGLFKTAIFYIQIMDTIIVATDTWPNSVYKAQAYFSSAFNLHFSSLACVFPEMFSLLSKQLVLFILPLASAGIVWSIYGIWSLIAETDNESRRDVNFKCRHYCLFLSDLAYFPIVKETFSVITKCREVDNISFMRNYPWINCDSSEYSTLLALSCVAVVVYVIGIPCFLYAPLLYVNRKKLNDENSGVKIWLGTLYLAYKPRYQPFMEMIMLMRRLIIALLLTVIHEKEQLQTALITTVLVMSVICQALAKPFVTQGKETASILEQKEHANGLENTLELLMLSVVLLSFTSTRLSTNNLTMEYTSSFFVITIIANSLLILIFCCCVLYRLLPKISSRLHLHDNEQPLLHVIDEND